MLAGGWVKGNLRPACVCVSLNAALQRGTSPTCPLCVPSTCHACPLCVPGDTAPCAAGGGVSAGRGGNDPLCVCVYVYIHVRACLYESIRVL